MIKFSISMQEYHLDISWAIMFSQLGSSSTLCYEFQFPEMVFPINTVSNFTFQKKYHRFCVSWSTGNMKFWDNWFSWNKYIFINLSETRISQWQQKNYWKLITVQNLTLMMGTKHLCLSHISIVKSHFPLALTDENGRKIILCKSFY